MTKDDLSDAVYRAHGGLSRTEALRVVDTLFESVRRRLVRGEKVLLTGFGCFRVVQRRDRRGVNPRTGEPMTIVGRRAVVFTPAGRLKSV